MYKILLCMYHCGVIFEHCTYGDFILYLLTVEYPGYMSITIKQTNLKNRLYITHSSAAVLPSARIRNRCTSGQMHPLYRKYKKERKTHASHLLLPSRTGSKSSKLMVISPQIKVSTVLAFSSLREARGGEGALLITIIIFEMNETMKPGRTS